MSVPTLSVRDLHVALGRAPRRQIIRGVSFDVEPGQVVGLVGESGSGKSTIAKAVFGFLGDADVHGSALLDGRDLVGLGDEEMRPLRGSAIGWIAQDPLASLNPSHRIGRQIAEAITSHEDVPRARVRTRVNELLAECGLPDPERLGRQYPHTLSGGMRQRVAIAIAIATRPRLLIADEPTTSLDNRVQAQILRLLDTLRTRHQMSVILISHDLGVVSDLADVLTVLYAGEVVESGPTRDVLEAPRHPYTRALIEARPRLRGPRRERFATIPGKAPGPPSLEEAGRDRGCAFRERCGAAEPVCDQRPTLEARAEPGHEDRCWRSGELEAGR
jgi:oligopeptide/dipeptide ABC transporter ATP-binding protein